MRFRAYTIMIPIAYLITVSAFTAKAGPPKNIREPVVSGMFYPSSTDELKKVVDGFLAAAKLTEVNGRILAVLVPHAGYTYSGQVAAEAFARLKGKPINTFVVVGPSHQIAFDGISVYPEGHYKTPLGVIEIDSKLAREIIKVDKMLRYYSPAHAREHAIEVELPFIQRINEKAKIVPMVVGSQSSKAVQVLENIFSRILSREDVVLVMSADLSHYHPYKEAVKLDTAGLEAVEKLDAREFAGKVNSGETEVDNPAGMMAMLMATGALGGKASLLKYANSGDVPGGDKSRVVGYGAVVVTLPLREEIKLNDASRKELLQIARSSLEAYLVSGNTPKSKPQNAELLQDSGAFVTLKKAGNLCGCIGYTQAIMPLCETVTRAAIAAATQDPRFKPVTKEELKEIEISISVLSPIRRIEDVNEIEVGKHGLVIKKGGHSGLLLPQVATEEGWNRMTFIQHTCRKAGLPIDAWKEDADIYVFTADVFSE